MPTYRLKRIAGNTLFFLGLVLVAWIVADLIGMSLGLDKSAGFVLGLFFGVPAGLLTADRIREQEHQDWMKGKR